MTTSVGISGNNGYIRLYNTNVKTTDYGVSPSKNAKLFVKGGTFQTHGHGPFYFSNGFGENYIEDAKIIGHGRNNYDGEFSTDNWIYISSCMYMGGGSNEHNSNVSANFNNCVFENNGAYSGYFVLRGTDNEQNLKLYISNTQFGGTSEPKYRLDWPSDHVYFGQGNTWPEQEPTIDLRRGATVENNIHNTDEVYEKANKSYLKLGNFDYKKVYIAGETFDRTGLELKLVNEDQVERAISDYEIVNEQVGLSEDTTCVTVKYNELEIELPIKVFSNENYYITLDKGLYNAIEGLNENISYINIKDDKVECIVNKEIFDNLFKNENEEYKIYLEDTDGVTLGKTNVLIKNVENDIVTTEIREINVISKELTEIEVTNNPIKTEYVEGEEFNPEGMIVTARYNDGSSKGIDNYEIVDKDNLRVGKTTVTISYKEKEKTKTTTCQISVKKADLIKATKISFGIEEYKITAVGQTPAFKPTIEPENVTSKAVKWTSSDTNVATVTASGVIKGISNGECYITATTTDGSNLSASIKIIVNIPIKVTQIILSELSYTFINNTPLELSTTVLPENATNKDIKWTSSDIDVAIVDENGKVIPVSNGTCEITAEAKDGSKVKAICSVVVNIDESGKKYKKGDMNKDGKVTVMDVRYGLKALTKGTITEEEIEIGDVNGDNKFSVMDGRKILRYIVGKIPSLD